MVGGIAQLGLGGIGHDLAQFVQHPANGLASFGKTVQGSLRNAPQLPKPVVLHLDGVAQLDQLLGDFRAVGFLQKGLGLVHGIVNQGAPDRFPAVSHVHHRAMRMQLGVVVPATGVVVHRHH